MSELVCFVYETHTCVPRIGPDFFCCLTAEIIGQMMTNNAKVAVIVMQNYHDRGQIDF